ncbi:MAG: phosphoglucomutase/phosphomannomutase PgmG [Janthinobacterium lividum]
MTLNPDILREYDIRGIVDVQFGASDAYLIGRGYGTVVTHAGGKTIAVGYDGRLSSFALEGALIDGLKSTGLHITRLGLGPSPLTYFATHHLKTDATIMVTGSHNPGSHNGFKMTLFKKPFFGEDIQKLGRLITAQDFIEDLNSSTIESHFLDDAYIDYLIQDFQQNYTQARPLKVIWDAGNGAVGNILKKMVTYLPGTHILLNETIDGTFPAHHPDPVVAENLTQLIDVVREEQADLGFAFDGDGDRIGVVDNCGHIIAGDQLMILLSAEVLKTHPNAPIIADVKASQILFDEIKALGGTPIMWRTGHSLIKAKMAEVKSPLAGEMSGHIFFADRHFGYDDALYAALRTLGIVATQDYPLSDWYEHLPVVINTPEMRFECLTHDKFLIVNEIRQVLEKAQIFFNGIDGVRMTTSQGWWLLRASNTSDELVARIEAKTQEDLEVLKTQLSHYLKSYDLYLP